MVKTLKKINNKTKINTQKFSIVSLLIDKNTPSYKFQALRKEDLYKKGRKGIFLNYIFFLGCLLFENNKKSYLRININSFNLKLDIIINKLSKNLLILKNIKYKKKNNKWA